MMIQSIVLILSILLTTFAATFPTPVNFKIQSTIKYKSPEERRKLGLFPKYNKKFVVTEKPIGNGVTPSSNEQIDKRPLMPRLNIRNKDTEITKYYLYKEPATRRPLMKYLKFTVDPNSSQKVNHAAVNNTKKISYEQSVEILEDNQDDYLEANDSNLSDAKHIKSDEKIEETQESVEEDNFTTELPTTDISDMENYRFIRNNITASEIISYPDKPGENTDLDEFIFVKNIVPRSTDEEEFTTDLSSSHIVKRAVNVIEEENLGTTISVLKFTGRETYLTNELNYKNIHS